MQCAAPVYVCISPGEQLRVLRSSMFHSFILGVAVPKIGWTSHTFGNLVMTSVANLKQTCFEVMCYQLCLCFFLFYANSDFASNPLQTLHGNLINTISISGRFFYYYFKPSEWIKMYDCYFGVNLRPETHADWCHSTTLYFFTINPPPKCPLTGELHKSIPCQCPCTVNGWLRYSTSTDHQHWWRGSWASISLHACLWAADILTRPQWKEQLGVHARLLPWRSVRFGPNSCLCTGSTRMDRPSF